MGRKFYHIIQAVALLMSLLLVCTASADEAAYLALLEGFLQEEELDGGMLLIADARGAQVVAAGVADRDTERAMTPDTRFYVASAGKMVVGAAVLGYVADGAIKLDAPIWSFIKTIPGIERLANSRNVTLRQLLNHTSGMVDYLDDAFFDASAQNPAKRWTVAEAVSFAYDLPALAVPGAVFDYSNTNYVLLGHILSELADTLSAALEAKVFLKAGMTKTSVGTPGDLAFLAHGYVDDLDVSTQAWASVLGDGPLVMSALDMGKFMFALLRDNALVRREIVSEMTSDPLGSGYGLGIGVDGDAHGDWYGHAGGYDGFEADVRYYSSTQTAFVFLTNGNQLSDATLLDAAADVYFAGR